MGSSLLISAKHGAYMAIGLYVAMVLVVSLSSGSSPDESAAHQAFPATPLAHKAGAPSNAISHAGEPGIAG